MLNACGTIPTDPYRIDEFTYEETGQYSYLWTAGKLLPNIDFADYAIIVRIDDINIPEEYLPPVDRAPYESHLIAIPAGKHTVRIIY